MNLIYTYFTSLHVLLYTISVHSENFHLPPLHPLLQLGRSSRSVESNDYYKNLRVFIDPDQTKTINNRTRFNLDNLSIFKSIKPIDKGVSDVRILTQNKFVFMNRFQGNSSRENVPNFQKIINCDDIPANLKISNLYSVQDSVTSDCVYASTDYICNLNERCLNITRSKEKTTHYCYGTSDLRPQQYTFDMIKNLTLSSSHPLHTTNDVLCSLHGKKITLIEDLKKAVFAQSAILNTTVSGNFLKYNLVDRSSVLSVLDSRQHFLILDEPTKFVCSTPLYNRGVRFIEEHHVYKDREPCERAVPYKHYTSERKYIDTTICVDSVLKQKQDPCPRNSGFHHYLQIHQLKFTPIHSNFTENYYDYMNYFVKNFFENPFFSNFIEHIELISRTIMDTHQILLTTLDTIFGKLGKAVSDGSVKLSSAITSFEKYMKRYKNFLDSFFENLVKIIEPTTKALNTTIFQSIDYFYKFFPISLQPLTLSLNQTAFDTIDYLMYNLKSNSSTYNNHGYGNFISDAFLYLIQPFIDACLLMLKEWWSFISPLVIEIFKEFIEIIIDVLFTFTKFLNKFIVSTQDQLEQIIELLLDVLRLTFSILIRLFLMVECRIHLLELIILSAIIFRYVSSEILTSLLVFVLVLVIGISRKYPSLIIYFLHDEFNDYNITCPHNYTTLKDLSFYYNYSDYINEQLQYYLQSIHSSNKTYNYTLHQLLFV